MCGVDMRQESAQVNLTLFFVFTIHGTPKRPTSEPNPATGTRKAARSRLILAVGQAPYAGFGTLHRPLACIEVDDALEIPTHTGA